MNHAEASRWPIVSEQAMAEIGRLLASGNTSLDAERFEQFEAELCERFAVRHALVTCNGTLAGFSAFHALGLGPGDDLVVCAYTHPATALSAVHLGCRLVFADSDQRSLNVCAASVERAITPATKAVVVCHLYGNPVDMPALVELCVRRGLYLIEDMSHAPGATIAGRPVGSFGHLAFCSLQAAKLMSAGEGGFLLSSEPQFHRRALELGHPKRIRRLLHEEARSLDIGLGFKFRPSVLHVALARDALRTLDATNRVRQEMFDALQEALSGVQGVSASEVVSGARRVHWEYDFLLTHSQQQVASVARDMQALGYIVDIARLQILPDLPQFVRRFADQDPCPNARALRDRLLVVRAFSRPAPQVAEALGHALGGLLENQRTS